MTEYIVATVDEIPIGQHKEVHIEGRSICLFNVNGEFYALRNICPHQGAPLSKGSIVGIHVCGDNLDQIQYVKSGEVIRCPWHGWEFDIKTGKSIFDPQACFVKKYMVTVDSNDTEFTQTVETYPTSVRFDNVIVHIS